MCKFTFIILFLASTTTLAKTPQQYCQSLEQRQSGSFEILNMVDFVEASTFLWSGKASLKFCSSGRFCYGDLRIKAGSAAAAVANCIKNGCLANIKNGTVLDYNNTVQGHFVCNN